jgi:hypothetical protein
MVLHVEDIATHAACYVFEMGCDELVFSGIWVDIYGGEISSLKRVLCLATFM